MCHLSTLSISRVPTGTMSCTATVPLNTAIAVGSEPDRAVREGGIAADNDGFRGRHTGTYHGRHQDWGGRPPVE
ncbi:hypothetical protein GCM10023318_37930 [Nocardia callitridis]|uniref:Uncharacterized protein n=1 Tax=Nocardia callitridis TaxID=648753 RepID=A0ABP9KGV5_9NOCA